jgi:hypothetical protein
MGPAFEPSDEGGYHTVRKGGTLFPGFLSAITLARPGLWGGGVHKIASTAAARPNHSSMITMSGAELATGSSALLSEAAAAGQ